ncbi:activator-dependent family glycosyltransferase [Kitasatospora sp. NPDC001119]
MRVLLAVMPSPTHLHPFVPLAWALQGAGHQVRVASGPEMIDTITAAGLTAVAVGSVADLGAAVRGCAEDQTLDRIIDPLAEGAEDPGLWKLIRLYLMSPFWMHFPAEVSTDGPRPMVDDLVQFARAWQPDLVLWDPMCFPAAIAARASGAAHARLLWGPDYFAWTRERFLERLRAPEMEPAEDLMARMTEPTLQRFGIEFDEELLVGQWTVDPMPERMRLPVDLPYLPVRRVPYTGVAAVPEWLYEAPDRPRVCLTLGVSTREHFDKNGGLPMAELLRMVSDLDVELVATLNTDQLAAVGDLPKNVRVIDYVPLDLLLPTCSAVIHHGGGGTFAAAAAHQVPQLVCARASGQSMDVARYVEDRGAGLVGPDIDGDQFPVSEVRERLVRLLQEPSFRHGAADLYQELLATPSPNDLVPLLEKLTAQHQGEGRHA